jgi:hypothetical protein
LNCLNSNELARPSPRFESRKRAEAYREPNLVGTFGVWPQAAIGGLGRHLLVLKRR